MEQLHKNQTINPQKKIGGKASRVISIYMLLAPAMILLFIFHYIPIGGILIAFKDYSPFKGILGSPWVGLKYFRMYFTDENFWRVMKNTIVINIYQLLYGFPVPIIFALLLNEIRADKFKKTVQTISYLPHFVSWVVVAALTTAILSPVTGILNTMLSSIFKIEPIYFLVKKEYFRTILVITSIWKGFGMSSVYYIASLASIDQELYQAAAIDGAGRIRQTWHITLPGLRNIIIVLLVINLGGIVSIGFEQIFLLYNPMVYEIGDVISTYTYRLGLEGRQYSLTTAIGLGQSLVNFTLVYSANRISRAMAGWSLW